MDGEPHACRIIAPIGLHVVSVVGGVEIILVEISSADLGHTIVAQPR
jgi:hypothetical protein